jgi:uncharacterized glyoxalase superfamily protein PhnB
VVGVPVGFRTITPLIIHDKAPELVDFIKSTFGAEELKRNTAGEAYRFYPEVRIGDSVIMMAEVQQRAGATCQVRFTCTWKIAMPRIDALSKPERPH